MMRKFGAPTVTSRIGTAVVIGVLGGTGAFAAGGEAANDEMSIGSATELSVVGIEEPGGFSEGARAMVCEERGFVSFVWGIDEELRSPQFPGATVQYADGLIVVTDDQELNGISIRQSSYMTFVPPRGWTFAGYRGTVPMSESCIDITDPLADSFTDLAMAASWGMPKIEKRVEIFDLLEDDLRTRLELAERDRDRVIEDAAALRQNLESLETELATARMAVCEIATHTQGILSRASFNGSAEADAGFVDALAEMGSFSDCIDDAIFVNATGSSPR